MVEENTETLTLKNVTKLKHLDKAFYEKYVVESGMYVNGQCIKIHPLYQSDY